MATTTSPRAPRATAVRPRSRVRSDIQGLRAVAVTLVVVYHLLPGSLTGGFVGVDVFLVVSGFLITSHLLAAPPTTGRELLAFWARRIRRLLPASLLVLGVSLVAAWLFLPETRWEATAREVSAAATYVVNWRLADNAVDYLAAAQAASPVQHFWSLSVEEQFYLGWPLLVLLLAVAARALRARGTAAAWVQLAGIAVVVVASFAWSVHLTDADPARAYFVTPTRIWELGAGGLLAAVLASRARPAPEPGTSAPLARAVVAWLGLAVVVATAVGYDAATPFPGWHAALPVLATVAVIAADAGPDRWSPVRWLGTRPVQWLGDVSYSVYLWHWPLIVIVPVAVPVALADAGPVVEIGILVATLLLAAATKTWVEDRFRRAPAGGRLAPTYLTAAAGMAVVLLLSSLLVGHVQDRQEEARDRVEAALAGADPCFGAGALVPGRECPPARGEPVPAPALAPDDKADAYADVSGGRNCWSARPRFRQVRCVFGEPDGDVEVVLVGNSHAGQWLPALQEIAADRDWRISTRLASRCAMSQVRQALDTVEETDACEQWVERTSRRIARERPDLVVVSNRISAPAEGHSLEASREPYAAGYEQVLRRWSEAGVPVVALHDTPAPGDGAVESAPECVATNADDLDACAGPRPDWEPADPVREAVEAMQTGGAASVRLADLNDLICRSETCAAVVGGALVYSDGSHLTATYARTLAPHLERSLLRALRGS
ncbi:acyltransferase family protein [Nocardioides pantholopis]|uniref:acyltransferase family protein n=1 Tax=Nocardioides pantholopis TaxID=2483798 RepID=UPI000FD86451|nr:acyltransferase family protein [Nocardioides pantholopis]